MAPLTFWVPDMIQAWNQNLIMKHGPPEQIVLLEKSVDLAKSGETTLLS